MSKPRLIFAVAALAVVLLLDGVVFALARLPAFPGAEGHGSFTPGGRGGRVIAVTNLNDSGPGSFRQACGEFGPRIVIFRINGTIKLSGTIKVRNPYLTIAGQTAPASGITLRGGGLKVLTHDVIVRGLKVRVGAEGGREALDQRDGLSVSGNRVYNVIFDHNSISWATDENTCSWGKTRDITFSYNIISEGLHNAGHPSGPHSKGLLIGEYARRVSIHHNLFAHNDSRNPFIKGGSDAEVINNVIYNWGKYGIVMRDQYDSAPVSFKINLIGNLCIPGRDSQKGKRSWKGTYLDSRFNHTKVYVKDNRNPGRTDLNQPDWMAVNGNHALVADQLQATVSNVTTHPIEMVYELVLDRAGASFHNRDPVDLRIVSDVINITGSIIDNPNQVGGWPMDEIGTAPPDRDSDGLPDDFEIAHGLSPDRFGEAGQTAPNGYTWVEVYINSLIPENRLLEEIDQKPPSDNPEYSPRPPDTLPGGKI